MVSVTMPPRSRLYPLPPQCVGTGDVESLTSYLMRLARAHGLTTPNFIAQELGDLFAHRERFPSGYRGKERMVPPNLMQQGHVFNGPTGSATTALHLLAHKTGGLDLRSLTFVPWRRVVAVRGLMRTHRAWCPYCYQHMRDQGGEVYDPLVWSVAAVTICTHHRTSLATTCPHELSGRRVSLLMARMPPGYCPSCGGWLGQRLEAETLQAGDTASTFDLWRARGCADLVGRPLPTTSEQQPTLMRQNISLCVDAMTGEQRALFCQCFGISDCALQHWKWNRQSSIMLGDALTLCGVLNVPPLLLLDGETPQVEAALSMGSTDGTPSFDPCRVPTTMRASTIHRPPLPPTDATRADLLTIVSDAVAPPPSLSTVARRLSCTPLTLRNRCPDLARLIVDRHHAFQRADRARRVADARVAVQRAVHAATVDGRAPTLKQIQRVGWTSTGLSYVDIKDIYWQAVADLDAAPGSSSP